MAKFDDWAPYIRVLIYGVQFEEDPVKGLDRVMKRLIEGRELDISPARYLTSVRMALASDACLSELIPQEHSEEAIRQYLREAERRLAVIVGEKPA